MIRTITLAMAGTILLLPPSEFFENRVTHQFGQLGQDVVLRCHTSFPYVVWKFNGREMDAFRDGSRHLRLTDTKRHQTGSYTCHPPHSNQTLSLTELQLGLPPEKLHIQCWSSSYPEKIKCTWDLQPETFLPTTFLTTYRLGLMGTEPPQNCIQLEKRPNCCLMSNFQMFELLPYLLNVTAINQLGSISQLYYFFVENIVRPDPPVMVTVSSICHESKKLHVRWRPPHSWPYPEIFPLKYQIRYRKERSKSYKTVGPYEETFLVLTGIRPGATVHVQVAAKEMTDLGHNSDWSEVASARPWKPNDSQCLQLT